MLTWLQDLALLDRLMFDLDESAPLPLLPAEPPAPPGDPDGRRQDSPQPGGGPPLACQSAAWRMN
jgi:hypothetical protein